MAAFRQGNKQAADGLVEIFYPQLRRLAMLHMKEEKQGHSWQPTLLVNELYLELIKVKALKPPIEGQDEKSAFFSLAAHMMKHLLIHHSRPLSQKAVKIELSESALTGCGIEEVAEIEKMLGRLEAVRPRLRAIVEMKVFEGLTGEEIAARLNCATTTVAREWCFAKHFLQDEMALPEER